MDQLSLRGHLVSGTASDAVANAGSKNNADTASLLGRALLIKLKIEMALQKGWYYKDSSGNRKITGGDAMASWYSAGYLSSNLLVSSSTTETSTALQL